MLQPSRTKYRKQQKGRNTGLVNAGERFHCGGLHRLRLTKLEEISEEILRHLLVRKDED